LLSLSYLIESCLDDSIDLTSDVHFSLIILFEVSENLSWFFLVVLEKSDHLLGILLG
jgi:hypothetical protein